jgi:predicted MFS family arabinose efflux permease
MLPDLAERARMPLERANSISTTSEHTGYVLGAPLAGILIAALGAPNALWVDAASFALSAGIVAGSVPGVWPAIGRTRMLDGLRFVLETPLLRTFFALLVLLPILLLVGVLTGAYDPFEATIHQELIPPDLRARAFGLLLGAEMTAIPLSMLLYGFLMDVAGLRAGLLFFAVGNALLGAYAVANRPARRLDPA